MMMTDVRIQFMKDENGKCFISKSVYDFYIFIFTCVCVTKFT